MRIAIDARAFGWPGLGRYTRSLLAALSRAGGGHDYAVMVSRSDRGEYERFRREHLSSNFSVETVDGDYYSLREQTVFLRQAQAISADLLHFPHFNIPVLLTRPYVVTIHDATRFLFPGQMQQSLLKQFIYELVFARAVSRARAVMCVSETTRGELLRLPLQITPSLSPPHVRGRNSGGGNLRVIYEGVEERFFKPVADVQRAKIRALLGTKNPFVLYVGVWMSHKNLPRLVESFREAQRKIPDLKLVLIGKPRPRYINMISLARALGVLDHVIFPGFVPEELLPALYSEASCVFLPSLYEGFGLPALEAAAVGTPVVTSNVSACAEIMGDAARLVNPEYVPGMARGLLEVLQDENLRRELITRGRDRAKEFSWDECAKKTLEVYQQAI